MKEKFEEYRKNPVKFVEEEFGQELEEWQKEFYKNLIYCRTYSYYPNSHNLNIGDKVSFFDKIDNRFRDYEIVEKDEDGIKITSTKVLRGDWMVLKDGEYKHYLDTKLSWKSIKTFPSRIKKIHEPLSKEVRNGTK